MPLPRLRPVDAVPVKVEGRTWIRVRDVEGIAPNEFLLAPETMFLAMLLNEADDVEGVQSLFEQMTRGAKVTKENVEDLIRQLDGRGLLFSPAYEAMKADVHAKYLSAPVRPSSQAGGSYPADAAELGAAIAGFFTAEGGPGPVGAKSPMPLRGAIAPHIDFARGGVCYSWIYKEIAERADADVVVILGVAHATPPYPFAVSTRGFETPLGVAPIDAELLDRLRKRAPKAAFDMEPTHRAEHSAEFQVVWLQHVLKRPFTILPILVGSFDVLDDKKLPDEIAPVEDFIAALREAVAPLGKRALILSGADLAHIGPRFGDERPLSKEFVSWMEEGDLTSLGHAVKSDAREWYASTIADGNARKVCGLGSVYTALRLLHPAAGTLVRYGYAPDPAGGIVSFAGVAFE